MRYKINRTDNAKDLVSTQIFMANELAEANRLKRLELRQTQGYYADYNQPKFNSLLGDKA